MTAHTQVVTRCFGSSKGTILIPFADQANHHVTDNEVQFFNVRLTKKFLEAKEKDESVTCADEERKYFTNEKKRVNFMKNFTEDDPKDQEVANSPPYKSDRYARVLKVREEVG